MYNKTYTIQPSRIYPSYARLVQHLKTGIIHHIKRLKKKNHMIISTDTEKQSIWQNPAWQPTPVFLPGESHGQRSPAGCSLQGSKESDTTEVMEHGAAAPIQDKDHKHPPQRDKGYQQKSHTNTILNVRNLVIRNKEKYSLTFSTSYR